MGEKNKTTNLSKHHDIKPDPKCFVKRAHLHSIHCVVLCISGQ